MGLPGFPLGDADVMRSRAHRLRALAHEVDAMCELAQREAAGMPLEGPAANRLRRRVTEANTRTRHAAQVLRETAGYLLTEAARVETAQAEWRQLKARLEEEAREAVRDLRSQ